MITTDTTNKLGITVAKDLRTVMQGKVAIAGEASYEGAPLEALDYDFNLSKLERVMSGAGKVAALGHELERRGLKRTIVVTGKTLGVHEVKERAVVDKPITEAEVLALLEASH